MLVNAAISASIIGLIAGVSVFRAPPAPPTIQEFAPANPARQLTEEATPAPAKGRYTAGPLVRPQHTPGVPSALQCWAWPDGSTTQTFDRQSPPCVSSWDAAIGNGGRTSRGVSRTEVRIGVPVASVAAWQPLATFFSRHYQIYGRTLRLVPLGIVDLRTAEGQRAAAAAAGEHGVFAALDDPTAGDGSLPDLDVYLDTLSGAHVVSALTHSSTVSTTALAAQAPYSWTYPPPLDAVERTVGTAICRELSGHRASHAKQTSGQTRRFAVLVPDHSLSTEALSASMDQCHTSARVLEYDERSAEAVLASARVDGVTTIVPLATARSVATVLMPAASGADFRPEWLLPGITQQQDARVWASAPDEQRGSLFGLASWPKLQPQSRVAAAQALHEVSPSARFDSTQQAMYDGLSLLAAGIQLAGPRLTAQAFADGLESTTFGNPGAGRAPSFQPVVGFQDVDHTMVDDVAQVWWRDDRFCFVGGGHRWSAGELPFADPGFFDESRGC